MTVCWRSTTFGLIAAAALAPSLAGPADPSGRIGGVIRYSSGARAPDVSVTISRADTGESATVLSDKAGAYSFRPPAPGRYSIRIEGAGFRPFERTGVVVRQGQFHRQDALLHPGEGRRAAARVRHANLPVEESRDRVTEARRARAPGGAGAGFLAFPAKRGTNEFHGGLYYRLGNDILNARGFFGARGKARRNAFGAFVGGPVVKDKTYFSYHYDRLSVRSGVQSGFGNSVPVESFRQGDFGRLLTGRTVASDALGRAILAGQIFDPASTRTHRGVPARDAFPNNAIPKAHPMRSRVSSRVVPFMVEPQRPGLEFNVQGNPVGDQIWVLDAPSHFFRLDHSFTRGFRTATDFSRASHPAVRNCGGAAGCRVSHDPSGRPEANADYYGTGVYEDVTTHHLRQRLVWAVAPNLLNQVTVGYDEFHVRGHAISAGAGWQDRLWGAGGNGLLATDAGAPALTFAGNTRYSPIGSEWGRAGFLANHQYSVAHHVTWVRGRHTFKTGAEFRHHRYPFRGWANNVSGTFDFHRSHTGGFDARGHNMTSTGDPFASFLLGQVNATHFQIPDSPTITESFVAWSVLGEYRATSSLTLTLGIRFDFQSALRERDDNMSTFDPNVPNPRAGGRLGAMIFAGKGPGRTGTRTLESPPKDAFGPRAGFAYRAGDRSVVRGAYGIYYSSVPHAQLEAVNTLGFRFHATANDLSNGRHPAYFLDDGFPPSNIVLPPSIDPSIGNNTSPVAVTRDRATLPRIQRWSLAIQRQLTRTATVDLSYEGNRGSRLIADRRVLGPAANANANSILDLGPSLLASRAGSASLATGVDLPYRGFARTVAQSLRPFPHMLNIGYLNVPAGNSFYHSLRTRVEKRFSAGAHLHASYAWSKLTGMGAGRTRVADGLGHGPQNPSDTHSLERGLSAEDVPHRVLAAFTHEVPFFRSPGLAAKVLGGWSVSGALRVESAAPVNVVMANDLQPFLHNGQKRPDVVSNRVRIDRGGSLDVAADSVFDRFAFADPGPLQFGDASRTMNFVRGFGHVSEDFSLFKDAWVSPKFKLRFETQIANAFNRTVFCDPNRNWSAASFGRVFAQCNSPRSVQFGLRFDF